MVAKAFAKKYPHTTAVLQALLVTFLWSTSWVLIKFGLADIPPLTFAGLRYSLAWLFLLPLFLRAGGVAELRQAATLHRASRRLWARLVILGVLFYAVTQGAQFVGLALLPAVTVNLLLGFSPVAVALLGVPLLAERPSPRQWLGIVTAVAGIVLYFTPLHVPAAQIVGMLIVICGVLAYAISAVIGRSMNQGSGLRPLTITFVSMGIGAALLLAAGVLLQGLPPLGWRSWAIIGWLALVNTAFAFTLWNHTLRTLTAMESSMINNTMAIQIPILAVIFLGERLTPREWLGLAIAIVGTLLVQLSRRRGGTQ